MKKLLLISIGALLSISIFSQDVKNLYLFEFEDESEYFSLTMDEISDIPIEIWIKKNKDIFTIKVKDNDDLHLKNDNGIIVDKNPTEVDDEVKFVNLLAGIYYLKFDANEETIKIRLK